MTPSASPTGHTADPPQEPRTDAPGARAGQDARGGWPAPGAGVGPGPGTGAWPRLASSGHLPAVLVVDDVAQNRLAMRALLARQPLQLLEADSGPAALELLLQHDVAVALLDVQMPGMDGFALAELMRGTERTRHVPIIFLTAGTDADRRSFRGYEAGAVDFLFKPLDGQVLCSKVGVFLDLHRQRRQLADRMAELERLARANARMLSVVTADLREPLSVLAMNAELLLRRADQPAMREAGARIKAAAELLRNQADHLANLARLPDAHLRPRCEPVDLLGLLHDRVQALFPLAPEGPWPVHSQGDPWLETDPTLLAGTLDLLLLHAQTHAGNAPVQLWVDGSARRTLQLTLRFEVPLPASASSWLLGSAPTEPGAPGSSLGPGLQGVERTVRSLGGSLIGHSRERDGTSFELMLPRQLVEWVADAPL